MNHWFNKKKFENKRRKDEAKEIIDLKRNWEEDDDICVCVFPSSSYIKRRQGGWSHAAFKPTQRPAALTRHQPRYISLFEKRIENNKVTHTERKRKGEKK